MYFLFVLYGSASAANVQTQVTAKMMLYQKTVQFG